MKSGFSPSPPSPQTVCGKRGGERAGGVPPGRGIAGVPTVKCGAVSGKPVTGPIFSVLAGDMTTIIPVNPQPPPKCPSMRKSGKKTQVSFWITCI